MQTKIFTSNIAKRFTFWEFDQCLEDYKKNMTAGKYLLFP